MDEDIDIEEHDLMDDPRVKAMFPDLSKVKVEPMEQDEDPANDCFHFENFNSNNYKCDFNVKQESMEVDYYPNKMILDSKPSKAESEEYACVTNDEYFGIAKEYLKTAVVLEDCGERLRSSHRFCKVCQILFPTENLYDSHKIEVHSHLIPYVNKAVKSTTKNPNKSIVIKMEDNDDSNDDYITGNTDSKRKLCHHCNKYFSDATELIEHLYSAIAKDDKIKPKNVKVNPESSKAIATVYECGLCHEAFVALSEAKKHVVFQHSEESPVDKIIERVVNSKFLDNSKLSKSVNTAQLSHNIDKSHEVDSLIPISKLYKCRNCNVHFLTLVPGIQHSKLCSGSSRSWKCDICFRDIRISDIKRHKLQHQVSNSIEVYDCDSNVYKKSLCKCPKCGVCFMELKFSLHFKECSYTQVDCFHCNICSEHIDLSKEQVHMKLHMNQEFTKNDFIYKKFAFDVNEKPREVKDKKYNIAERPLNKITLGNKTEKNKFKLQLFYCDVCEDYMHKNSKQWLRHKNNICTPSRKSICQQCGLPLGNNSSHRIAHELGKATLHDFKFYLMNGTRTVPKIPDFYPCVKCSVLFMSKNVSITHRCKDDYKVCEICSKKFSPKAYKLHIEFHLYLGDQRPNGKIAELKPQSKMWNILFYCQYCNIHVDSYDEAVLHSHNHLVGEEMPDKKHCKICDLAFDTDSYKNHLQLHKSLPVIKKDFLILVFNYNNVLKSVWFKLFGKLSPKTVQQIISQSIYKHTRCYSMKLRKAGSPEHTLYACEKCNLSIHPFYFLSHIRKGCTNTDKYCESCNINFPDEAKHSSHERLHKMNTDFRIVEFQTIIRNKKVSDVCNEKQHVGHFYFKCVKCDASTRHIGYARRHICTDLPLNECDLCGIKFRSKYKSEHMKLHRRYKNLSKSTVRYKGFSNDDGKFMFVNSSKCENLKKRDRLPKTFRVKNKRAFKPQKKNCKKCGVPLKFGTLWHMYCQECRRITSNLPGFKSHQIFKCSTCQCHYIYIKSLRKHASVCTGKSSVTCSVCGLEFKWKSLHMHMKRDHAEESYSFTVVDFATGYSEVVSS